MSAVLVPPLELRIGVQWQLPLSRHILRATERTEIAQGLVVNSDIVDQWEKDQVLTASVRLIADDVCSCTQLMVLPPILCPIIFCQRGEEI